MEIKRENKRMNFRSWNRPTKVEVEGSIWDWSCDCESLHLAFSTSSSSNMYTWDSLHLEANDTRARGLPIHSHCTSLSAFVLFVRSERYLLTQLSLSLSSSFLLTSNYLVYPLFSHETLFFLSFKRLVGWMDGVVQSLTCAVFLFFSAFACSHSRISR